jgi:hypothetical protein
MKCYEMEGTCGTYVSEDKCLQGSVKNPKGIRQFLRYRSRWEDTLKLILKKQDGKLWKGHIWLRIRSSFIS